MCGGGGMCVCVCGGGMCVWGCVRVRACVHKHILNTN